MVRVPPDDRSHRRWQKRMRPKHPHSGNRGSAWLEKARRRGLGLVEHNRSTGMLWVRGKVNGVHTELVRHPRRSEKVKKWRWTLRAKVNSIKDRIGFRAEYSKWAGMFEGADYTSGDSEFDRRVRLSGEPHILCIALTHSTRRWIAKWVEEGATLVDGRLTAEFHGPGYGHEAFGRVDRAVRLLKRLDKAVDIKPVRLMQIAVHDQVFKVRLTALRLALALPGGPLSSQPDADWAYEGAMYQALVAAAHAEDDDLQRLGGIHLARRFVTADASAWSETMLVCAAKYGEDKGRWDSIVNEMAHRGQSASRDYLVDYASSWFGLRKGVKTAEKALAQIIERMGGDLGGGVSLVEPMAEGAISLIAPIDEDD